MPAKQSPGFIKQDPGKNGGVVVITGNHFAHGIFPLSSCLLFGFAPEIGHIGHDQQAQFIRPVEFTRNFRLDMYPVAIESDLFGSDDLIPHKLIAGIGIESLRMIGLVETQLKIYGFVI